MERQQEDEVQHLVKDNGHLCFFFSFCRHIISYTKRRYGCHLCTERECPVFPRLLGLADRKLSLHKGVVDTFVYCL